MPDHDTRAEWIERVLGVHMRPESLFVSAKSELGQRAQALSRETMAQAEAIWAAAYEAAQAASRDLQTDLLLTSPAEAKGLQRVLHSYWQELDAGILLAARSGRDAGKLVALAGRLRSEMQSDRLFNQLEQSSVRVRTVFVTALDKIMALLPA